MEGHCPQSLPPLFRGTVCKTRLRTQRVGSASHIPSSTATGPGSADEDRSQQIARATHWLEVVGPTHTSWQWLVPHTLACNSAPTHTGWGRSALSTLVSSANTLLSNIILKCILCTGTHVYTARCICIEQPHGEDGSASLQYALGALQVQFVAPWSCCGPPRGLPWHPAAPE